MNNEKFNLFFQNQLLRLEKNNIPSAKAELVQIFNSFYKDFLTLQIEDDFSEVQKKVIEDVVSKRIENYPLQYILGSAPFADIELLVGEGVFIPRFETETLFEVALNYLKNISGKKIVFDFAAGTGAIGFALAKNIKDLKVYSIEKYLEAYKWLEKNYQNLKKDFQSKVYLLQNDVTEENEFLEFQHKVDLITFNPPYVPENHKVSKEVIYEPAESAVFAKKNGLEIIEKSIPVMKKLLKNNGKFILEHDETHVGEVYEMFADTNDFINLETIPDLTGRPRFLSGYYRI